MIEGQDVRRKHRALGVSKSAKGSVMILEDLRSLMMCMCDGSERRPFVNIEDVVVATNTCSRSFCLQQRCVLKNQTKVNI